ncbi:MAG: carbohydrate-binding protein, partial [Atopostipes suicloacalis]|nr:carbohydrate-binding protein [Atopostipes suicloacalis]
SVEESTVNNMVKMSPEKRKEFIRTLVDPVDGMGNTLFRVTIGTSDFTGQDFYTYYDGSGKELNGEPDWYNETGNGFSIQNDIDYGIIQVIKEIQTIAKELGVEKELRFFASSWTPPGWMKTETAASQSYKDNELLLKGGRLNDDHIADLAKYYVRYLEEYEKQGITMYAMTMQNEPLLEIDYPSAYITGSQEAVLAKHIKEELAKSETLSDEAKATKVWAFDHNFDGADNYIKDLFATEDGRNNVDGLAFHPYGGSAETMGSLYNQYKNKYSMHLTERSVWGTEGANDIITWFRNGSESYNGWVTMLDSNVAPHQWVGTPDPTMFVQDANNRNNYWATPEVYMIGQFSKYIRPGYVRIASTNGSKNTVTNVTFKDPKTGRIILVATNRSNRDQAFKVTLGQTQFNAVLPEGNTATYMWDPVDLSDVKEITDDLTLDDPVLSGNGEIDYKSEKLEYIDDTTNLTYTVNVKKPGSYKVEFDVAVGKDGEKSLPIQISQEDKVLATAHAKHFNFWGGAWEDYRTVQTYIDFDNPGIQSFDLTFPNGGMNFKDIQFTKEEAITSLPGILDTTNYFDKKGLVVEDGPNFGFSDEGEYIDYKVNIQKTDEYNVTFDAATNTEGSGLLIEAIDKDENTNHIGEVNFKNTNGTDNYEEQTAKLNLKEGEYTLRFKFKSGDTNLRQIIIGSGIKIEQPDLIEGELNGKELIVNLVQGKFAETLDKNKWNLDIPDGVDFKLERIDDQQVKITLIGEINEDFDANLYLTLSIDASQLDGMKGTSVKGKVVITAIDDPESLKTAEIVENDTESITIKIDGGTFTDEVVDSLRLSENI